MESNCFNLVRLVRVYIAHRIRMPFCYPLSLHTCSSRRQLVRTEFAITLFLPSNADIQKSGYLVEAWHLSEAVILCKSSIQFRFDCEFMRSLPAKTICHFLLPHFTLEAQMIKLFADQSGPPPREHLHCLWTGCADSNYVTLDIFVGELFTDFANI